jgi:heptosyltransferase-2
VQAAKEEIAVVLPNHLGDVVMATPALRALARGRPDARLVAVIREELAPVLGGAPWFERVIAHRVYRSRGRVARLAARLRVARELRGVDTVVVFPNSFSSALVARWSGAPERVGYARRGRSAWLTRAVAAPRRRGRFQPLAMERYYLELVAAIGCSPSGTELELFLEPDAEAECERRLAQHGIDPARGLVCIAPGAAFGPSKLWPLPYWAELAGALLADGRPVALVHAPGEEALADEIRARTGSALVSLGGAGMTLALLKSVIARARLLVCNDAGARHVAAAFGVRTLVLMGPTALEYTNMNLARTRLLRHPVPCAPCQRPHCPIDHRCLRGLLPARVLDEARRALEQFDWKGDVELELAS